MGRKKKVDTEAATTPVTAQNGAPAVKTKADAFRAAIAQGIVSPKAISEYVKTTYGMEMSAGMVSAYKSLEKNKSKKKAPNAPKAPKVKPAGHETGNGVTGNPSMLQLEAIKVLVKDLGAGQ